MHDQGLFISPYHPDCWGDLWRMEIQFHDEVGQLNKLIDLFDHHRIHILHASSRNSFKSKYHVKYFMLDCTHYHSEIDMTSTERFASSYDDMIGLRYLLQLEFIESIRLLDDGRPRLRISRNLVHLNMAQDYEKPARHQNHLELIRKETRIQNSRVPIPSNIHPRPLTYAVVTTNAKAHVIYCSFNEGQKHQSCHVFFHFDGRMGQLGAITRTLKENQFNVIRSQLRQGLLPDKKRQRLRGKDLKIAEGWTQPFTLNVLVEAQHALAVRGSTIFDRLAAVFTEDLKEKRIFMFESRPQDLQRREA